MKFQFDAQQQYQLDGIRAVVDLFTGQPAAAGTFEWQPDVFGGDLLDRLGVANALDISGARILENLHEVQRRNFPGKDVAENLSLDAILGTLNFSVEMETGTGKTYVYLRTIYELHREYGWKKFVIVVPSVAIREGVLQSLRTMREHFDTLYNNTPLDSWVYDSAQVSRLRQFAVSNQLQVLVMNIQAFDKKDVAVVHRESDRLQGRRPIEFIQQCRPVVIMDEPQNMESENAKKAIAELRPLLTLRYSATHRNLHNPVYRLDPVRAYDLRLVKRIEVASVTEDGDFNRAFVALENVTASKAGLSAKVKIDIEQAGGVKRKQVTLKRNGDDLYSLSGHREMYRGYVVTEINAYGEFVSFGNGVRLQKGESRGGHGDAVLRLQVEETVREHFKKELALHGRPPGERIKVLSLFFIDRVAHYAPADGKIRKWFEESYRKIAALPEFAPLAPLPAEEVHNGYFAADKDGVKDSKEGKSTKADDEAYHLIMEAKEKLLAPDVPLRFIFSHSALREGWDNPNVFQICTLREGASEIRKRQEIGRGLRLARIESGARCEDTRVNRLTVIASESFADFAGKLQTEFEEECGVSFAGRIADKRKTRKKHLRKGWELNADFRELWDRIKHKTRYQVEFETPELVKLAAKMLSEKPEVPEPNLLVTRAEVDISKAGVQEVPRAVRSVSLGEYRPPVPDVIGYLQRETELTRSTLAEILLKSKRVNDALKNPQVFMELTAGAIGHAKHELMIDGIKYERIAGQSYDMMLFKNEEVEGYLSRMVAVKNSLLDYVEFDSELEKDFAEALDQRDDIKFFVKLPDWFRVKTPLGDYNPDWAIVKETDCKVYLVRETKGSTDLQELRPEERGKIKCGERHFQGCLGVSYKVVKSASAID
ncbi:MAG: DEAD/DEAH box helicase family protein [Verrucomicrobiota bacterium]